MATLENQLMLFESYFKQNDIWKANVLIKNIFNKNVDNVEVFQEIYQFSMKLANYNIDLPTRKMFLEQALSAVHLFSEKGHLTETTIEMIQKYEAEVEQLRHDIVEVETIQYDRQLNETKKEQQDNLLKLTQYKFAIIKCTNESTFQSLLEKISSIEEKMNERILEEQDAKLYQQLTAEYPTIINDKLTEFEKQRQQTYNEQAVKDFHYVYNEFKNNEDQYRTNILALESLVRDRLFLYDAAQLLNETLIYYNHVYAYLFGKLDEDSKFSLTKLAIQVDKS